MTELHNKIFGGFKRNCCFGWSDASIFRHLMMVAMDDKYTLTFLIRAKNFIN